MDKARIAHPAPLPTAEGLNSRAQRALELYRARGHEIRRSEAGEGLYLVPSCSGRGFYAVEYGEHESCECPDFEHGLGRACKHVMAVGISVAKRRGASVRRASLAVLEERLRHELMNDDERQELRDRILRMEAQRRPQRS